MSYSFGALDCRKIVNERFNLPRGRKGEEWVGHIPEQEKGLWPRAGSEAICVRMLAEQVTPNRQIQSVMKIFKAAVPHRAERQRFLVKQKLAKQYDWMFQCVPYSSFNITINNIPVMGHLSRYIAGGTNGSVEDFDRLKQNDRYDQFTQDERRNFVADLATAVLILETKNLVHGDLSDGNALIASGIKPERPVLTMCDFDGFYHKESPMLERAQRALGTPGYIPPFLIEDVQADADKTNEAIFVASDRFALAAMACELMSWNSCHSDLLEGRYRILDMKEVSGLRDGSWAIPAAIVREWPAGFELLEKAVQAKDWNDLPSPRDWLALVDLPPSIDNIPYREQPFGKLRAIRKEPPRWKNFKITGTNGSFQPLSPNLAAVRYMFEDGFLTLDLPDQEIAMVGPIGRAMKRCEGPCTVGINPNMRIVMNGIELHFRDGQND